MRLAERLSRYKDLAWFVAKYARADFVTRTVDDAADPTPQEVVDARAFAADLESLGPTFIKLGQFLSTRGDLLPPIYLEALTRLQDDLEPFAYEDVERIVQEELGVRLSKAFDEFEPKPIAAASLGQVHRAVLRGGRVVAVKVQRPGIREQVLKDLDALNELAPVFDRFAGASRSVDTARVIEEMRHSLVLELDYREEARNMVAIAAQLRDFERIVVPLPVEGYSTARVLTMDFIPGINITTVSPVERTEVDGATLAEDLFRAYLQQILVHGVFHADPHPGNVLLTPDHRLGLIDLGMVGRLSPGVQEQLVKLVLAISEGRGDEAARVTIALSDRQEDFDESAMVRAVASIVSRYQGVALKQLNIGRVRLDIMRTGGTLGLRIAPDLALLGKALLNLDEIGRVLDPEFDVNASIRRNANTLMQQRFRKAASPANLWSSALEVRDFAQHLPGRINRILDALAGDNLKVKVEVIDHGSIIEGLQKVANRIALGLVLAALIVGAAMLMRVPTEFTILGYPGLAMLLFLAAAGGGFWMTWNVLLGDVRTKSRT